MPGKIGLDSSESSCSSDVELLPLHQRLQLRGRTCQATPAPPDGEEQVHHLLHTPNLQPVLVFCHTLLISALIRIPGCHRPKRLGESSAEPTPASRLNGCLPRSAAPTLGLKYSDVPKLPCSVQKLGMASPLGLAATATKLQQVALDGGERPRTPQLQEATADKECEDPDGRGEQQQKRPRYNSALCPCQVFQLPCFQQIWHCNP